VYKIRTMTRADIDLAIEWASNEGWNPGINDAESFYNTDPNGFFMGELDGEPIGCISAVAYDNTFGFIGFYIVKAKYRGKYYGIKLWNKAMEYLNQRTIGLDGVVGQQENYRKSGFKLAYRNIRFEGVSRKSETIPNFIRSINDVPNADILDYDDLLFPVSRHEFVKTWIYQSGVVALAAYEYKKLKGYGVIRPCQSGFKIGPLFANDQATAQALYNALTSSIKSGEPVYLDVSEINESAVKLAENNLMDKVFETARMYTDDVDSVLLDQLFGVTSFELG